MPQQRTVEWRGARQRRNQMRSPQHSHPVESKKTQEQRPCITRRETGSEAAVIKTCHGFADSVGLLREVASNAWLEAVHPKKKGTDQKTIVPYSLQISYRSQLTGRDH